LDARIIVRGLRRLGKLRAGFCRLLPVRRSFRSRAFRAGALGLPDFSARRFQTVMPSYALGHRSMVVSYAKMRKGESKNTQAEAAIAFS
ncbi:hypothetical protein NZA98_02695, partial [Escherichia coli]|nr:hypothetical protein [Escherichia coli]